MTYSDDWAGPTRKVKDLLIVYVDVFDRAGRASSETTDSMERAIRAAQQAMDQQPTMHRVLIFERPYGERRFVEVDRLERGDPSRTKLGPERKERPLWLNAEEFAAKMGVSSRTIDRWRLWPDSPGYSHRLCFENGEMERVYDFNLWRPVLVRRMFWDEEVDLPSVPPGGRTRMAERELGMEFGL